MAFNSYQYEFAGGDRTEQVQTIDFQNDLALTNVFRIKFFKEEDITGVFQKKEFRYSFDNAIWSNWTTLTQQNVTAIQTRDNPNFYFHVRYTRTGIGAGNILRFYLFYDSDVVPPGPTPADPSIDADYLGGEPPAYYLDRANFFGPFLDLQAQNVVGPGSGVYHSRLDTSMGTTLFFKRIADSSTVTVTETSTGIIHIETSGTATGVYDSALDPSTSMIDDVGGIPAGTQVVDLDGQSYSELWDELLFPTAAVSYINPSVSLLDNLATLVEIGSSVSVNFTSTFDKGDVLWDGVPNGQDRSGDANTYNYVGTGLPATVPSILNSDSQSITGYTILQGNQSWRVSTSYDIGPQPLDNKGNPSGSPLPAGTTPQSTVTTEGVYPLFGTTSSISTVAQQPLVSMLTANNISFAMVAESGGQKQRFEIPAAWNTPRPLQGVETFNTVSNQWEYQGGSAALSLTFWGPVYANTHPIQGNSVTYVGYIYNGTNRGAITIRLKF